MGEIRLKMKRMPRYGNLPWFRWHEFRASFFSFIYGMTKVTVGYECMQDCESEPKRIFVYKAGLETFYGRFMHTIFVVSWGVQDLNAWCIWFCWMWHKIGVCKVKTIKFSHKICNPFHTTLSKHNTINWLYIACKHMQHI